MMRTTILVTALLVSMLSASAVYAQRVESVLVNGHPVINCDRMQSSMYTTVAKGNTEEELKMPEINKKVYRRFAVYSKNDLKGLQWPAAFTLCSGIKGGGWRLSTQRELMLMWVLKSELEKAIGFIPFYLGPYWSATEYSSSDAYGFNFSNGISHDYTKKSYLYVRCVKELP